MKYIVHDVDPQFCLAFDFKCSVIILIIVMYRKIILDSELRANYRDLLAIKSCLFLFSGNNFLTTNLDLSSLYDYSYFLKKKMLSNLYFKKIIFRFF